MDTKLTTLTIRIPEEMKDKLKRAAFARSTFDAPVTTAAVAREVLSAGFEAINKEENAENKDAS